jgi:hypothetical protein
MFHHIVFFKLKNRERREDAHAIKAALEAMRGKIPELRHLEIGVDIVRSERSWDVALVTRFDSRAAMETYQDHPEHKKAIATIKELREQSIVVDWEE